MNLRFWFIIDNFCQFDIFRLMIGGNLDKSFPVGRHIHITLKILGMGFMIDLSEKKYWL